MINLDRAAAHQPYPRFDADLNTAVRMWRNYGRDSSTQEWADQACQEVAAIFGFLAEELHWFNSATAAVYFLSEHVGRPIYCSAAEHKCSRDVAARILPMTNFEIETDQIQKNALFIVSLKNNELGFGISEQLRAFLASRPTTMWLAIDATGADPADPLIKSADFVFASPSKWGALPGSGLLLARQDRLQLPGDRWSGWGKGTPSFANIATTAGALRWIQSPVGIAASTRNEIKFEAIQTTAAGLGWQLNNYGVDIASFNIGIHSDVFLAELLNKGVIAAKGAACMAGEDSPVIEALYSKDIASQTIRISWDRLTKLEDISSAMKIVSLTYAECKRSFAKSE